MRRTRRKRGYGKTIRRSRTRTGRMMYRKRRSGGINRRWRTYTFTRMCDMFVENEDPAVANPSIHVDSMGSVAPVGNMCTPWVPDTTYRNAAGCTSYSTGLFFKLNNLQNVSEFINSAAPPAGLFEEYKITGIKIEFEPYYRGKDLKCSTRIISDIEDDDATELRRTFPDPTIYYTYDHDGANYLNWPIIQEMGGVQRLHLKGPRSIWVKPRPVDPVGISGAGGSAWALTKKAPWITNRATNIEHYGVRLLVTDWPGPSDQTGGLDGGDALDYGIRIRFRYFFKVRGVL